MTTEEMKALGRVASRPGTRAGPNCSTGMTSVCCASLACSPDGRPCHQTPAATGHTYSCCACGPKNRAPQQPRAWQVQSLS